MKIIVTLLTDFGTIDGFVGAMKGVILSRAPEATMVDLTHYIAPQDVRGGAWALRAGAWFFPTGTIHVAVVDPGVGTSRRPLLLRQDGQLFLGPDNGLLSLAAPQAEGWVLDRPELFREPVSNTFHGRDIFAAVAGYLAAGLPAEACGSPTNSWITLPEEIAREGDREICGQVIHVDRFGNLITNISIDRLDGRESWILSLANRIIGPLQRTYGEVPVGSWVAFPGSSGRVEIAIREGRADVAAGNGRPFGIEVKLCAP